ncbi:MAG: YceI family protein [Gammaproteobacteria bacterium]|nr:YceI family protein [Gammaproteobacteria bacterium]
MQKISKAVLVPLVLTLSVLCGYVQAAGHAKGTLLKDIPSGKYDLDLAHASILWKVSHFGYSNYIGRFTDFSSQLNLDTENFTNSSVSVEIKIDSIDTAYPHADEDDFDKKLSQGWFKSEDSPVITFNSTKVSELTGHSFTFEGEMTMAGQTHPLVFEAKLNGSTAAHPFANNKPLVGFSAQAIVNRTKWGVSKYAPKVGAEVTVQVEGEFVKAD